MCEYVYENGEKCKTKPLQGSQYCSLHIPYEEGELLYGEKIKEIKKRAFLKKLKRGVTYFEGVYLYDVRISNFKSNQTLVFKNSKIKTLIIDSSEIGGLTIYSSSIERIIIFETTLKTLMIAKSNIFGVNILRLKFSGSLYLKDSGIRYIMMNSFQYVKTEEKPSEEEYGERSKAYGRIELFNINGVRRIGINSRYPLLRQILEEHGIRVTEVSRKHARAEIFVISGVHFDENPRFKRQVRVSIRGFNGQLLMENLEIPGHVQITQSKVKLPEFVHVKILNNIIFRKVHFYSDVTWNLTVLPNLVAELDVEGFILLEECQFNNSHIEEIFYRLARTTWEKSGDKDKADEYYYKEMVAKRKQRMTAYRKGKKKIILIEPYVEWLLADLTCKYGTTWKRPIVIWIITVNIIFPILFYITKSVEGSGVPLKSFLDYVYFSIVTATTLGYGDLHPVGIGRVLASGEAIFGMFMWAVLLTVFARKYMR
ncbi:MAG: two pore domain potassium channel family protein [Thermococcus sp.]|uniref:potassium channel family protein n=1 Tax=Thermococcus sp. TaxID=35749 RepID=UPI001D490572|nr:potassium channel family protein [Thermococcus sp.]MBO8174701.1 two pore domain potassium channel family protein [Thermococcus sp.]